MKKHAERGAQAHSGGWGVVRRPNLAAQFLGHGLGAGFDGGHGLGPGAGLAAAGGAFEVQGRGLVGGLEGEGGRGLMRWARRRRGS